MAKPASMLPATTARPYVLPRFNAAMAADLAVEVEVEDDSLNEPKPAVVAVEPAVPEAPVAVEVDDPVEEDTLATVGFWAPQGWACL